VAIPPDEDRCTGLTKAGTRCKRLARPDLPNQRCLMHAEGEEWTGGAPKGNKNAQKHGVYSHDEEVLDDLAAVLGRLKRRLVQLDRYIDEHFDELEPTEYARFSALQGQLSTRIGRMERDLREVQPEKGDGYRVAINEALDWLAEEWNLTL